MLYSYNEQDEHAPLKVVNAHKKKWKKEKRPFGMEYVGGWYATSRQKALYVTELADLPSKEELVGKFLFLLNHPVSGFARVLQAIADKQGGPVVVEAPVAEIITETPPSAPEAVSEEVTSAPETTPTDEVTSETA